MDRRNRCAHDQDARPPRGRRPSVVLALGAAGLLLAACATAPFDASAPWRPTQDAEGRSYQGGMLAHPPAPSFGLFSRAAPETIAPVELPAAGGENPWATPPRNPIVTVCHGRLLDSEAEVVAAARELCPAGSRLARLGSDSFWNDCPLLQPHRTSFQCITDGDIEIPEELRAGP